MDSSTGYYVQERRELFPFLPERASRILEVGCAEGRFAAHAREMCGANHVCGIELDPKSAEAARKRLDRVLLGSAEESLLQLQGERFDLIILNDVLEHLVDPAQVLHRLRDLLEDRGQILASLPNVRYLPHLFELLVKKDWRYRDSGILDRTHLRFFTRKSALRLFEENGFRVVRVSGVNPLGWAKFLPFWVLSLGSLSDTRYLQFAFLAESDFR